MPFEDEFRERPRGFWLREMFGVFLLFWMVLLLMSLLSYSPSDPSLNHALSRGEVANLGGLLGAYTAGFLNDLFGSGSLLLPLLLGGIGLGFLSQRLALTWWRWLGCALTSFSVLVFLAALDVHIGDLRAGGMIGAIIYRASKSLLSPFGAALLWLFFLFVGVQLFVDLPWRRILERLGTFFSRFVVRDEEENEAGSDRGDFILMEDENRPRAARLRKTQDAEAESAPEGEAQGLGLRVLSRLKGMAGGRNNTAEEGSERLPALRHLVPVRLNEEDIPFASCETSDVPLDRSYAGQYAEGYAERVAARKERESKGSRERVRLGNRERGRPLLELLDMEEETGEEAAATAAREPEEVKDLLGETALEGPNKSPAACSDGDDATERNRAAALRASAPENRAQDAAPSRERGEERKAEPLHGTASDRDSAPQSLSRDREAALLFADAADDREPAARADDGEQATRQGRRTRPADTAGDERIPAGKEQAREELAREEGPRQELATGERHRRASLSDLGSGRALREALVDIPEPLAPDLDEPDEDEEDEIPARPARAEIVRSKAPEPAPAGSRSASRDGLFLPPLELLQKPEEDEADLEVQDEELEECEDSLMGCLGDFGIQAELVRATPGPVVTTYMLRPAPGVSVRAFIRHTEDIARALMAVSVFIQAPVPGTDTVGIVIPNRTRAMVNFRQIAENAVFAESTAALPLIVGKDTTGQPFVSDLAKMPHLLVAGATGQGKSVCLNAMLTSLLLRKTPTELKLLLVDPKRVEMGIYEDESHLVHPVVKEVEDAKNALLWAVREMDQRYSQMSRLYTKNIQGYNAKLASYKGNLPPDLADLAPMPYIVIVIDELADLMLQARKDVEPCIIRLAQLARACGIHMIIATQRPSVDVVTGLIKANFPSRICFRVSSRQDSITTLGQAGAEKLLGNGDMFFNPNGGHLIRLHGPFLRDEEVQSVVDFWKRQVKPNYQVDFATFGQEEEESASSSRGSVSSQDAMYQDVIEFCREKGHVSISLLQRRFNIGFNKAARYMDQLDRDGLVGPSPGAGKPRPVLIR